MREGDRPRNIPICRTKKRAKSHTKCDEGEDGETEHRVTTLLHGGLAEFWCILRSGGTDDKPIPSCLLRFIFGTNAEKVGKKFRISLLRSHLPPPGKHGWPGEISQQLHEPFMHFRWKIPRNVVALLQWTPRHWRSDWATGSVYVDYSHGTRAKGPMKQAGWQFRFGRSRCAHTLLPVPARTLGAGW